MIGLIYHANIGFRVCHVCRFYLLYWTYVDLTRNVGFVDWFYDTFVDMRSQVCLIHGYMAYVGFIGQIRLVCYTDIDVVSYIDFGLV